MMRSVYYACEKCVVRYNTDDTFNNKNALALVIG